MAATPRGQCPIHCHAQARPHALALRTPARRWTYRELDAAIAATATRLQEASLQDTARVALQLRRGADSILLLWALWRTGRVAMPLSTRLPAEEVQRMARRMNAACLVARQDAARGGQEASVEICTPDSLVERTGRGEASPEPHPLLRRATIVFTSGSTGTPTAVLHSWANHVYSAKGSNANLPLRPGDRWLLSLPLYHVGGLAILVRCALAGAAVAVPDPDASLSACLDATGATHVSLVATQLRRLLESRMGISERTRAILLGGGPVPEELLRRGVARDWPLLMSYGSTEMASQVTTTAPGAPLEDLRTAGRCLPHRRLRLDSEGHILVAGRTLCLGVAEAGQFQDPRTKDWFRTGDVGHLDAQGRLHVQGRIDRQFISGGENIQPEEIEAVLERIGGVERAVVVAVPDEEYGRRPVAFVRSNAEFRPDAWRTRLGEVLPRFKIPDAIYELPEAAVTDRMKVSYDLLRQRARRSHS